MGRDIRNLGTQGKTYGSSCKYDGMHKNGCSDLGLSFPMYICICIYAYILFKFIEFFFGEPQIIGNFRTTQYRAKT